MTRDAAWNHMSAAGAQLMTWFGLACELQRDLRNDVEGLSLMHVSNPAVAKGFVMLCAFAQAPA